MAALFLVHKHRLISHVALAEHTCILQSGVLAVSPDTLIQQVCSLFGTVAAGGDQGQSLALPQRRAVCSTPTPPGWVGAQVTQSLRGSRPSKDEAVRPRRGPRAWWEDHRFQRTQPVLSSRPRTVRCKMKFSHRFVTDQGSWLP